MNTRLLVIARNMQSARALEVMLSVVVFCPDALLAWLPPATEQLSSDDLERLRDLGVSRCAIEDGRGAAAARAHARRLGITVVNNSTLAETIEEATAIISL